jgi:hypothetical protein
MQFGFAHGLRSDIIDTNRDGTVLVSERMLGSLARS